LAFVERTGRNRTPDKLPVRESKRLKKICDTHLHAVLEILEPKWVIGVGGFAADAIQDGVGELPVRIGRILHPSPASPAANRDWAGQVTTQLQALGAWE
jgi:single-strand selective monofunctional uracil DNA glycosylase